MYLFIFSSGEVKTATTFTNGDEESCNDGVLDVMDFNDSSIKQYVRDEWVDYKDTWKFLCIYLNGDMVLIHTMNDEHNKLCDDSSMDVYGIHDGIPQQYYRGKWHLLDSADGD